MHLEILYQDKFFVAINKPNGLLVHRTGIAWEEQEEFALQILRDQIEQYLYPIHRLDRKTSGVLLFALDKETAKLLQAELSKTETQKRYLAIVRGYFPETIELNKALYNDKEVLQQAETHFTCLEQVEVDIPLGKFNTSRYSLIEAKPKTGRMHQIRKHCNHLRHPIIGDRPHGCNKQNKMFLEKYNLTTMLLHAQSLQITHPRTQENITIKADFFPDFKRMISELGFGRWKFEI